MKAIREVTVAVLAAAALAACATTSLGPRHSTTILPGKTLEECFDLSPSRGLEYRFSSTVAVDFNVHFHHGEEAEEAIELEGIMSSGGILSPTEDQRYCLSWRNSGQEPATLDYYLSVRE